MAGEHAPEPMDLLEAMELAEDFTRAESIIKGGVVSQAGSVAHLPLLLQGPRPHRSNSLSTFKGPLCDLSGHLFF